MKDSLYQALKYEGRPTDREIDLPIIINQMEERANIDMNNSKVL